MTAPAPRPPTLFEVPPATPETSCKSCRKPVYWITTVRGKKMPVDCHAGAGCQAPTEERPGTGVSHFVTCPDRDKWRKHRGAPAK